MSCGGATGGATVSDATLPEQLDAAIAAQQQQLARIVVLDEEVQRLQDKFQRLETSNVEAQAQQQHQEARRVGARLEQYRARPASTAAAGPPLWLPTCRA